jgi:hypothetical protein
VSDGQGGRNSRIMHSPYAAAVQRASCRTSQGSRTEPEVRLGQGNRHCDDRAILILVMMIPGQVPRQIVRGHDVDPEQ